MRSVVGDFKKQQLIKRHQLSTSWDPVVSQIHQDVAALQQHRHKRHTNEWKVCVEMEKLLAEVKRGQIVGRPTDGEGIGFGVKSRA